MSTHLSILLKRLADEKAQERKEQERREAEERQREDAAMKDAIRGLRGEKPIEQPATEEEPDFTGSYSWWKTAEKAEAEEQTRAFIRIIRQ